MNAINTGNNLSISTGTYKAIQIVQLSSTIEQGISNLQVVTLSRQPLKANEIRVQVYASALNYFDLLMLIGKYQYKPALPFTIGSEGSGVIIEVGSKVKQWKVGDAVMYGMTFAGTNASEMVIEARMVLPKPAHFTFAEAAGLIVGYLTAYHALIHRARIQANESLLVTGAGGGMGLAAVQLGHRLGAKVIAAASSEDKLKYAKQMGAQYTINYSVEEMKSAVAKYTDGKYADVIYEVVGGRIFEQASRSIGSYGRLLIVGFASGSIPSIQLNMPLVKGYDLIGVRSGAEMQLRPEIAVEMFRKLVEWTSNGDRSLAPLIAYSFSIDNFRQAYEVVNAGKVIGKSIVQWLPEPKVAKL